MYKKLVTCGFKSNYILRFIYWISIDVLKYASIFKIFEPNNLYYDTFFIKYTIIHKVFFNTRIVTMKNNHSCKQNKYFK